MAIEENYLDLRAGRTFRGAHTALVADPVEFNGVLWKFMDNTPAPVFELSPVELNRIPKVITKIFF